VPIVVVNADFNWDNVLKILKDMANGGVEVGRKFEDSTVPIIINRHGVKKNV
jgi:hypothetical protein